MPHLSINRHTKTSLDRLCHPLFTSCLKSWRLVWLLVKRCCTRQLTALAWEVWINMNPHLHKGIKGWEPVQSWSEFSWPLMWLHILGNLFRHINTRDRDYRFAERMGYHYMKYIFLWLYLSPPNPLRRLSPQDFALLDFVLYRTLSAVHCRAGLCPP